jgi:putative exporter of polyketide antibiotics
MEAPVVIGWWAGLAAGGLAFGIIAKIATGALPKSMADVFGRIGLEGTFLRQFFGVVFLMVAARVALVPASQVGAAAEEETSGRLVHVLVHPVRRSVLLAGRLLLATVAVVGAAVVSGVAAWCGARLQGVDPGFVRMLGAGVNVVPTAMVVLGLAAVTLSVAPRYAARSTYAIVIWSLLVDLFSSIIVRLHSLERFSLLHYMALAPAQPVDVRTAGITVVIALALCALAVALYGRRDLRSA